MARTWILIILWVTAIIPAVMLIAGETARSNALNLLSAETALKLSQYTKSLENEVVLKRQVGMEVAHSAIIRDLIHNQDRRTTKSANVYLEKTNDSVFGSAVYVMNLQGDTIATSNWREDDSFLGKNYAFRPYFKEAIAGISSTYIAVGITSGLFGVYLSEPIYINEVLVGVVVIKTTLERHRLLSEDPSQLFVVADENGIVFLSSFESWHFRTLRALLSRQMQEIISSRQFANKTLQPLDFSVVKESSQLDQLIHIDEFDPGYALPGIGRATHLSQASLMLQQGWEIRTFSNLSPVRQAIWSAYGASALIMLLILLGMILFMQRRAYIKKLRDAAIYDELTGMYSRRHLDESSSLMLYRSSRGEIRQIACCMLDIDHFKKINDSFGHKAGDKVLRETGRVILSQLRKGDVAVRYGGEEFTIMLGVNQPQDAVKCIERIRKGIHQLKFKEPMQDIRITISGGIVFHNQGESIEQMIHRADLLLYKAKHDGRDRLYSEFNSDILADKTQPKSGTSG